MRIGIPGLYVTGDPGAADEAAKGDRCRSGSAWAGPSRTSFTTGQCPVMRYNRQLMMAILHDRVQIAKDVNATPIPLDQAPRGYAGVRPRGCQQVRARPARHDRSTRNRMKAWRRSPSASPC